LRNFLKLVLAATIGLSSLLAQRPTVAAGGVLNVASYTFAGLPNHGIAKGSMFIIYGTNLGPATLAQAPGFPLPTNVGGSSVRVTVGGTTVDALILSSLSSQIVALLPSSTPEGEGTLTVTANGQTSATATIRVLPAAFGMFTLNQAGSGPAIVQNVADNGGLTVNTYNTPARPGQLVILWGTGLGPVTGDEAGGPRPGNLTTPINVYVGGQRVTPEYTGRSGCCAGIDQINFRVPATAIGCSVPVVVQTGDIVSNVGTLSVSTTANSCSDPGGVTDQELLTAQQNGLFRTGYLSLTKTTTSFSGGGVSFSSKSDSGSGDFERFDYNNLIRSIGFGRGSAVTFGACTVFTSRDEEVEPVDPIPSTPLDAGPVINISGPGGNKQMLRQNNRYSAELGGGGGFPIPGGPAPQPEYLLPGTYTLENGTGGSGANAVGGFRTQITVPAEFTWQNMDATTTVNRSAGLPVNWFGGNPDGYVTIFGSSSRSNPDVGAGFVCTARVRDNSFTVPSYVLLALPATTGENIGILAVSASSPPVKFTATGLDSGTLTFSDSKFKTVTYR
jgi:uncharacterized protein (TIGR03437 family)